MQRTPLEYRLKYGDDFPMVQKSGNHPKIKRVAKVCPPDPDLFKPALSNSIDSYYNKKTQSKLGTQCQQCFNAILAGKETQREISEHTMIPRHLIPDRLQRLLKTGRIMLCGTKLDPISKMKVLKYKVT
jgi:hypothetical protein